MVWPACAEVRLGMIDYFSSRVGLFPFVEASSQDAGSLCHGRRLVLMELTSPTWQGLQHLKRSSQDTAQSIMSSP